MTLATSKACLQAVVDSNTFPVLNFVTSDYDTRINAATTFGQVYFILVELNAISAALPNLISSTTACTTPPTEIYQYFMTNAGGLVTVDVTAAATNIGNLASLSNAPQPNVVAAINEFRAGVASGSITPPLSTLTTIAQTSLLAAVNELQGEIKSTSGTAPLSGLTTSDKTSLVSGINELRSQITPSGTVTALTTLTTTTQTSLVGAINELQGQLKSTSGTAPLSGLNTNVKTSIVGAINEVNSDKYSFSMGTCGSTSAVPKLGGGKSSPAATLAADLATLFAISSSITGGSSGEVAAECFPRLQCIMKPGTSTLCPKASAPTAVGACAGYTISPSCDSTWFCNLNRLRLIADGAAGDPNDDGDTMALYVAKEICPQWVVGEYSTAAVS